MPSGGWAKCSERKCENNIGEETSEEETRCKECITKCSTEHCDRKIKGKNKICNFCKSISDIQCETNECDSFLTKDEVKNKYSFCISCRGEARCHNWPECNFIWDGNAQHDCDLDYDMSTSEDE